MENKQKMKRIKIFQKVYYYIHENPFKTTNDVAKSVNERWETVNNIIEMLKEVKLIKFDLETKMYYLNHIPLSYHNMKEEEYLAYIGLLEKRLMQLKENIENETRNHNRTKPTNAP